MKIKLVVVGKIKEQFYKDAIDEYMKRISPMANINIIEVKEVNTDDIIKNKKEEANNILEKVDNNDYVITLEILGSMMDSVELAKYIDNHYTFSASTLCFIIGGSDGLDESVIKRSDMHVSFSKFTFPHQLMRVILLEQLYRALTILNNKTYHK